jgi:dienelactone hydrolase
MPQLPVDTISCDLAAHPPRLAFGATTAADLAAWQDELRTKLLELSGVAALAAHRPAVPELLAPAPAEDCGSYTRQRLLLRTTHDWLLPFYLLRPKGAGPFRLLLALHGHGDGARNVVGLAETPAERERIAYHRYAYAVEAVERGYLVAAPCKRGFGEAIGGGRFTCRNLSANAIVAGLSVIGLHTWDNQRLLDYLATRPDVRPGPFACIGLSGGGGGTLWLAALDPRIGAAVISGHLANYDHTGAGLFGCVCNAVPGLLHWADRSDIAGLIAPRPLLIESADQDECYSRARTLAAYAVVERIYEVAGQPERLALDCFPGHHCWSGRLAWDFLARHLP